MLASPGQYQRMVYLIRAVRANEWLKVKELTLSALADPVAPVAFATTLEERAGQPDSFWQERVEGAARGAAVRQFIAEGPDGSWAGIVVVLVERPGNDDFFGKPIRAPQAQLVGVFVRVENRGSGLTEQLFEAGIEWAWSLEEPVVGRVRLFVHADNERAAAFYQRFGFVATGMAVGAYRGMEIARV
ncbi:GNAT family N-acetyltransferase [Streptomyces sp. 900116325]